MVTPLFLRALSLSTNTLFLNNFFMTPSLSKFQKQEPPFPPYFFGGRGNYGKTINFPFLENHRQSKNFEKHLWRGYFFSKVAGLKSELLDGYIQRFCQECKELVMVFWNSKNTYFPGHPLIADSALFSQSDWHQKIMIVYKWIMYKKLKNKLLVLVMTVYYAYIL